MSNVTWHTWIYVRTYVRMHACMHAYCTLLVPESDQEFVSLRAVSPTCTYLYLYVLYQPPVQTGWSAQGENLIPLQLYKLAKLTNFARLTWFGLLAVRVQTFTCCCTYVYALVECSWTREFFRTGKKEKKLAADQASCCCCCQSFCSTDLLFAPDTKIHRLDRENEVDQFNFTFTNRRKFAFVIKCIS